LAKLADHTLNAFRSGGEQETARIAEELHLDPEIVVPVATATLVIAIITSAKASADATPKDLVDAILKSVNG